MLVKCWPTCRAYLANLPLQQPTWTSMHVWANQLLLKIFCAAPDSVITSATCYCHSSFQMLNAPIQKATFFKEVSV
eukprot:6184469-Pleurochrysis_carterae.AAC.1